MGKSYRDVRNDSDKFEKRREKRTLKDKMSYSDEYEDYKPKNKKR